MITEINSLIKQALDRGAELVLLHDYPTAEEIYRQVLRIDKNLLALQMLILVTHWNGRTKEAYRWAKEAIKIDRKNGMTWNNMGLISKGRKALQYFRRAVKCDPKSATFQTNLAIEYGKAGRKGRAAKTFVTATNLNPYCPHINFNHGTFWHERRQLPKALECYERALSLDGNHAAAHYNTALCHFLLGDYEKGWKEYEWRWQHFQHFANIRKHYAGPYWDGKPCDTLCLYCEQGIGDLIMFSRYIPLIKERVKTIILLCDEHIAPLLKQLPVVTHSMSFVPVHSAHCSVVSLAGIVGPSPYFVPYLSAIPRVWPAYEGLFKIGLCWAGNPVHPNDVNRSMALSKFKPLMDIPGIKWFSLQKDYWMRNDRPFLHSGAEGMSLVDLREQMTTWHDTAEIIMTLDLVITVDTAVAHLAGTLGKKTILLVPKNSDWRWGLSGSSTPWYPSMTLVRDGGDWIKRVGSLITLL